MAKITGFDDLRIKHFKALVTKLPKGAASVPEALRADTLMPLDKDGLDKFQIAQDLFGAVVDAGGWADSFFQLSGNSGLLRKLANQLIKAAQANRFRPLQDEEVPERLADLLQKWRLMAAVLNYYGPVAWLVPAGVTLKKHLPKLGPCRGEFQHLQSWNFADEPTSRSLAFWIPRVIPDTRGKSTLWQLRVLETIRSKECYRLPEHHLSNFGQASILAGLIFCHFRYSDEKVPPYAHWVLTDSLIIGAESDNNRLYLGDFGLVSSRLDCQTTDRLGAMGALNSAAFPLALEPLMPEEFPELSSIMMRD